MQKKDNQYQRKARYNPNRETYVDENGNYVYLIWDEERQDYRHEVITVGDGGITPELRAMLDEMDAEEERRLDADDHHIDKVFEIKKKDHGADKSGHTPHPMDLIPQRRQRTFQDAFNSNGNKGIACGLNNLQLIRAGEPLGGKASAESDFATDDDEDFLG